MRLFLEGIDPGEVYTGVVTLRQGKRGWVVDQGVINMKERDFVKCVHDVTPTIGVMQNAETFVVTEEFRFRPVGFNNFSYPATAQLIGAIRYWITAGGGTWVEVPPGKDWEELKAMNMDRWVDRFISEFPSNDHLEHCVSAWRALFMGLFRHSRHADSLLQMASTRVLPKMEVAESYRYFEPDQIAPTIRFSL